MLTDSPLYRKLFGVNVIATVVIVVVLIVAEHQAVAAVDDFVADFDPQNWYSCYLNSDEWLMRASIVLMVAHNSSPGAKMMLSVQAEQMVSIVNGLDQFSQRHHVFSPVRHILRAHPEWKNEKNNGKHEEMSMTLYQCCR